MSEKEFERLVRDIGRESEEPIIIEARRAREAEVHLLKWRSDHQDCIDEIDKANAELADHENALHDAKDAEILTLERHIAELEGR
jgi:hypothetical protein